MEDFEYNFAIQYGNLISNDFSKLFTKCALIMLKPECLLMNKVDKAFSILKEINYYPIYISIKKLTQTQALSLWKYDWLNATTSRVLLNCKAANWSNSAIVLLKDKNNNRRDSCEYLNSLKGASINSNDNMKYIRGQLGTINNFLNFIHCADNHNEMVRELLILFDFEELIEIISLLNCERLYSKEKINSLFKTQLNNYAISDTDACFKSYINSFSQSITNNDEKNIYEQLIQAYNKKTISPNLFIELFKHNKIDWTWNNLVTFTQYTDFTK